VSGRIDILLLGAFIGPSAVAYYNVAARIPTALIQLEQSYIAVFFPTMTELLARGKQERAHLLLNHSLRLLSFALGCVALISVLFSQQIITLLFSDKYAPSIPVFALLMIALHMTVLVNLLGYSLTSAGSPQRSLAQNLIRTTLTILIDLALIPALGVVGPAYAGLIAYYVSNPICAWLLKLSGIRVIISYYLKSTLLLLLCVALYAWTQPNEFLHKVAIIILFLALNIALSTVSFDDLRRVLPQSIARRLRIREKVLSDGH
jgi:O-antigen/teichoic acid export membrane protein